MIVLVTTSRREGGPAPPAPRLRPQRGQYYVIEPFVRVIREAGGTPLLLPAGEPDLESLLRRVDAVVLSGGAFDVHPRHYGQLVRTRLDPIDDERTLSELALARLCIERDLPILGVCGGMQTLAVATGGTLIQDIATECPEAMEHQQPTDPVEGWHQVLLEPSILRQIFGRAPVVNSTHHQAVADPGTFRVAGYAPDGLIEAIELPNHCFCAGVQWHPELMGVQPFRALVEAARARG